MTLHYFLHQWLAALGLYVIFYFMSNWSSAILKLSKQKSDKDTERIAYVFDFILISVWMITVLYLLFCSVKLLWLWSVE